MAASDAKAIPVKNAALRITFPILDADGDLVSGATGLDSEVSIDGAAFADCTNEATEIGSSGMYYLDLTAAEMNGDTIVVIVKTTTVAAKTSPLVMYPAARNINDLAFPTTSGRSIDVTATGAVGIDLANVEGQGTTLALTATTIKAVSDVDTKLGSPAGASVSADIAAAKADTAAIKAKTDNLPSDPADASVVAGLIAAVEAKVDIIDGVADAILVDTAEIGAAGAGLTAVASAANLATLATAVDNVPTSAELATALGTADDATLAAIAGVDAKATAIQAKTDNLPSDPADASVVAGLIAAVETKVDDIPTNAELATALAAADDAVLAAVATRASQTSVDDVPTNAELATALASADDAVLAAVATVDSKATAIQAKTDNLPSDPADASVVAGLIAAVEAKVDIVDGVVDGVAAKTVNLPADPADASDIAAAFSSTIIAIASRASQASVDDLPTNAELATALAAADDPVLAAVGTVGTNVTAIRDKTDELTFTVSGVVDANVQRINDVVITGDGQASTEFGVP